MDDSLPAADASLRPCEDGSVADFLDRKFTEASAQFDIVMHYVNQAIAAERERCAKVAESFDDFQYDRNASDPYGPDLVNEPATRRAMAAEIRKG